jgi:acetolactate synthase regulatory subunit
MRQPLDPQLSLGQTPIDQIHLDGRSRFELIPILAGLQHLEADASRRDQILGWVASDVLGSCNDRRGRGGMSFWQILVLAVIRQGCNYDYAALEHAANHDELVRQFLQQGALAGPRFAEKTIHENVSRLRPETLERIVYVVAQQGHQLLPEAVEQVRGDSFVVQTNIHYPTDSNLLVDGIRKLTTLSSQLADEVGQGGWRQAKHLHKKAKQLDRKIGRLVRGRRKDREVQLQDVYGRLIDLARKITDRSLDLYVATAGHKWDPLIAGKREEILAFTVKTDYVASLAERRVIQGESIGHDEKIFSLFEAHTELINRGKRPCPIEFGHRVLVVEDKAGLIVHIEVMQTGLQDVEVLAPTIESVQQRLNEKVKQASFDRGFWSPHNDRVLHESVERACLPRRGAPKEEEHTSPFIQARRHHAGVESKIGALQSGNGQSRCRDQGEVGYARYVMLGALSRNLQTLGRLLLAGSARARAA